MIPAGRNHGLDLLRALAILGVLLLHAGMAVPVIPSSLQWIFSYGWSGVDLFFVLSGFLIGRQVFEDKTSGSMGRKLKVFWIKRWYRTFPLYFFVLGIYSVIKPMIGNPFNGWSLSYLFFFQNYLPPQDFVQSWSLCIEEQFYVVFPILAYGLWTRQRNKWFWLLPMLVSFLSRLFLWNTGMFPEINDNIVSASVRFPTHTHLDGISCGVFLAATFPYWNKKSLSFKRTLGVTGLALLCACFYLTGAWLSGFAVVYSFTLLAIAFSLCLIGVYDLKLPSGLMIPIYRLSLWSYSLYLWNNLAMKVPQVISSVSWPLQFMAFFGATIIISVLTYEFIEVPFLRFRENHLRNISAK
jgi:peptidoglycan/LPS O-acetylase OafA/YrhL